MKRITAKDAVKSIKSGDTLVVGGSGAGHGIPDALLEALGKNFVSTGLPQNITVLHPCGVGDNDKRGLNHLAHVGLVKRDIGDSGEMHQSWVNWRCKINWKPIICHKEF